MSEAGRKTEAWREGRKREGYVLMSVWVPAETKAQFDLLRARRGQTLASCLTDAAVALTKQAKLNKTFLMDEQQLRRLMTEMMTGRQAGSDLENDEDVPLPMESLPMEALPPGLKRCKQGHVYAAMKDERRVNECPECATARKRRQRSRNKQMVVG